ncbi:PDGLE domain-containing protein [Microbacterium luticocti]|uniref:PDGLE domain-containing protein n=1 Tax=Microbacterium luticocti TaxID=451764 RepID=UPI0004225641|nr:PDGLE domain-containing protein [Microbacterium luticocti]
MSTPPRPSGQSPSGQTPFGDATATAIAAPGRISTRTFTIGALIAALLIACVISLWASSSPDGLEFVAAATGFEKAAAPHAMDGSALAGYETAGVHNTWLSVAIAGFAGCLVTFAIAWVIGRLTKRRAARAGA